MGWAGIGYGGLVGPAGEKRVARVGLGAEGLGPARAMIGLVLAGEAVFMLPFHIARFFRPTLLEVFGLTATELGVLHSIYGVTALLAYFPSGLLADRLPARSLLALALGATALGGLYLLLVPGFAGLCVLFGFWGVSTILPLWGALIRATRRWGGPSGQGRAYGWLEGGRGLFAAVVASSGAALLAVLFPDDPTVVSADERSAALLRVIAIYVGVTAMATVAIGWSIPADEAPASAPPTALPKPSLHVDLRWVLRLPTVWALSLIVFAAYAGYKGMDDLALFAVDAWGYDEVEAARLVASTTWLRPLVCIGAGFLGDRVRATTVLPLAFALLAIGELVLCLAPAGAALAALLAVDALVIATAVFALRAVYFALLHEARIPLRITGAAIGVVSLVGFLPELFVNALGGALVDAAPGALGHQRFAAVLAGAAMLGLGASLVFRRLVGAAGGSQPADQSAGRAP